MIKLELKDVSLDYADGDAVFRALDRVSFAVARGEFVSLIGSSGCGKSTTLNILAGLKPPSSGQLLIDGLKSVGTGKNRGVVFQHYSLFPWLTARQNITLGLRQLGGQSSRELSAIAGRYLDRVGLTGFEDKYPYQLSGGMQQRVAIARVLALRPEILLMDEPFGAVDAKNKIILQDLLLELLDGDEDRKTVIFVTHDVNEAILLSDRVLFMRNKRIEEDIAIDLPRPRKREDIYNTKAFGIYYKKIMVKFYQAVKENIGDDVVL
ncbi:MAG: ABC transporter ATP-binding protein [Candidatus Adiutrix sp.]|jgi:NitT/TauT family transport system ATP-binding protein|nr:ABC transporter ATP-binding protein [Candidatus Adiutrix sp.]